MVIDGVWWLAGIIAVIVILFAVAYIKKPSNNRKTGKKKTQPPSRQPSQKNSPLQKLYQQLSKHLPEYQFTIKRNHLTISLNDKKLAMITLNTDNPIGNRKLGEVVVMNYHQPPRHQDVSANLQKMG